MTEGNLATEEWQSIETIPHDHIIEAQTESHGTILIRSHQRSSWTRRIWLQVDRGGKQVGGILIPIVPLKWRHTEIYC